MAGRERDVIAQRQQLARDRVDQVGVVAAWEIRAADAACEQHVTHEGMACTGIEEDHMAWRVPRAVQHLQRVLAEGDGVAILEPLRRREGLGLRKAEHLALLRQGIDPELIPRVRADDGHAMRARQRAGGAGVIDVRVREPQGLEREAALLDGLEQCGDVTARVDQGGFVGLVAPDQGAVLGEGCYREGLAVEHGSKGQGAYDGGFQSKRSVKPCPRNGSP